MPNQFELAVLGAKRAHLLIKGVKHLVGQTIEKLFWLSERSQQERYVGLFNTWVCGKKLTPRRIEVPRKKRSLSTLLIAS